MHSSGTASSQQGSEQPSAMPSGTEITFTDDLGRSVSLTRPERTAALTGSFADMWVLAGGRDSLKAAAHDTWTSFDLHLTEDVTDLGEIKSPSLEKLIAADVDFVLASAKNDADKQLEDSLESAGITVAYFDVSNFDDYLRMLRILTDLTGNPEAYRQYGTSLQQQIDHTIEKSSEIADPPAVLYLRAAGSSVKAKNSQGSVLGEMLADLHTRNIADQDTGLLEDLSLEAILLANPDKIFIVCQGADDTKARAVLEQTLLSNPAWTSLDAVKKGEVYYMDQNLYNLKPNARWAEAYEKLYRLLYENEQSQS